MQTGFDPGALLARSYQLPKGPRVCLRLARGRDLDGIMSLLEREGLTAPPWELAALVRSPPRERLVLCATALVGSSEMVIGVGAIELSPWADPLQVKLLVVDHALTTGLAGLIEDALVGRADALLRARAA